MGTRDGSSLIFFRGRGCEGIGKRSNLSFEGRAGLIGKVPIGKWVECCGMVIFLWC